MAVAALGGLDFDPADVGVLVTAGYWSLGGPTLGHRLIDQLRPRPPDGQVPRDRGRLRERGPPAAARGPGAARSPGRAGARGGRRVGLRLHDARRSAETSGPRSSARPVRRRLRRGAARPWLSGVRRPGDRRERRPPAARLARPGSLHGGRGDSMHALRREPPAHHRDPAARARRGLPRSEAGSTRTDVDHWLLHPGGRGILEGAQRGLGLSDQQVAPSAAVLSEYGNVGTASSFFVLRAAEEMRDPTGRARRPDLGRPGRDRRIDVVDLVRRMRCR